MSSRERFSKVIGPIVLIAIGVIFLLYNLNIITTSFWDLVVNLWPLLMVGLGLSMLLNGGSIFFPLTLIAFAFGFLLDNYGIVDWDMWQVFGRLWPLFLVAVGLDIIVLPRLGWVKSGIEQIEQPLDGLTSAGIKIEGGAGRIAIDMAAPDDRLLTGEATVGQGEHFHLSTRTQEGRAKVKVKRSAPWYFPFTGAWTASRDCQIHLNPAIPTDLKVDGGLGTTILDLQDARLSRLNVDGGIGRTELTLPGHGQLRAKVDGGIGDTTIRIPANVATSMKISSGLGIHNVQGDFVQHGNVYISTDVETAEHRIDLDIDHGVGALTVVQI